MLVCWDFIHTLKIITRTLSEVVNRERLCGTSAVRWDASARWVAVRPLEEVLTQSIVVDPCNRVSAGMVLMGVSRGDAEFALLDLFSARHAFHYTC